MKKLFVWISWIIALSLFSCEKEDGIDPRDAYVGKYEGIEIYRYEGRSYITNCVVYLRKTDEGSVVRLELPPTRDSHLYRLIDDEFIPYYYSESGVAHYAGLKIEEDSLFVEYWPGLAPIGYIYEAVKTESFAPNPE